MSNSVSPKFNGLLSFLLQTPANLGRRSYFGQMQVSNTIIDYQLSGTISYVPKAIIDTMSDIPQATISSHHARVMACMAW